MVPFSQIPTWPELEERLIQFMQQYNETVRGAGMDLVFFKDAMVHLMKVATQLGMNDVCVCVCLSLSSS